MDRKGFKIGDKVRLTDPPDWGKVTKGKGLIVGFDSYIRVDWQGTLGRGMGSYYPHKVNEIELAVKVGEQLMFEFMKG